MNKKLWAGVAAAMVILSCTGWYMSSNTPSDDSIVVVSRVNTEGSGIFGDIGITYDNPSTWGGKVFITPGVSSIQHMILQDLVENHFHMKFQKSGTGSPSPDTVYWMEASGGVGTMKELYSNGTVQGGIVWEPIYSSIILDPSLGSKVHGIILTNDLDPGHACCVIGVNRAYAQNHGDDLIRFLAAYTDVVEWMNKAKAEGGAKYDQLVAWAVAFTGQSQSVVVASLTNVTYQYELTNIKSQISNMIDIYTSIGLLSNTVEDLGFNSKGAFTDWFVNDRYLAAATTTTVGPDSYTNAPSISLTVACLAQDIHQLALYIGGDGQLGTFKDYKITLNTHVINGAGGIVATELIKGIADIGFLGAPPATLFTINMGR